MECHLQHQCLNGPNLLLADMKKTRRAQPLEEKLDEYRQIMGYIATNGGYVSEAVKALGLLTVLHQFRIFAKEQNFILKDYALAWQRYGNWMTVPGPYKTEGKSRYIVPAICLLCNERFELNLINAKTGKTKSCKSCGMKGRRSIRVLNVTTGEMYASIMNWTNEIGLRKQYQTLRIQITENPVVTIDDNQYTIAVQE